MTMKAVTLRLLKALLRASKVYAAVKDKNVRFKSLKKERAAANGIPPIIQEKGGITPPPAHSSQLVREF